MSVSEYLLCCFCNNKYNTILYVGVSKSARSRPTYPLQCGCSTIMSITSDRRVLSIDQKKKTNEQQNNQVGKMQQIVLINNDYLLEFSYTRLYLLENIVDVNQSYRPRPRSKTSKIFSKNSHYSNDPVITICLSCFKLILENVQTTNTVKSKRLNGYFVVKPYIYRLTLLWSATGYSQLLSLLVAATFRADASHLRHTKSNLNVRFAKPIVLYHSPFMPEHSSSPTFFRYVDAQMAI